DRYMRQKGLTYFENSRRATYAQRAYAIANPLHWTAYGDSMWGLTASDVPPADGGYEARGAPPAQNDDGTITPTAPVSSIGFALVTVGVDATPAGPAPEVLLARPNPLGAATAIRFTLAAPGAVRLAIFDTGGRRIATLAGGTWTAGQHEVRWNASRAAAGVYF